MVLATPASSATVPSTQPLFGLPKTSFQFQKPAAPPGQPVFDFNNTNDLAAGATPAATPASSADTTTTPKPEFKPLFSITPTSVPAPAEVSKPAFTFPPAAAQPPPQSPQSSLPAFQFTSQGSSTNQTPSSVLSQSQPDQASIAVTPPSSTAATQPTSFTPAQKEFTEPPKPKVDKSKLLDQIIHYSLASSGGLLDQYVEFVLPDIVRSAVQEYEAELLRITIGKSDTISV